ncbi:PaaI family thioesterase [Nocardioides sp. R1-1]|uniref:PaaI family thioesterase n=1 Tax=Nocardioides sp. R1-1 TaxID=3383502 RepID=UPI0038D108CF
MSGTLTPERPTLAMAAGVLAAQPFNDLVGARITRFEEGEAVLELTIEDRHRQQHGLVHGGVLAYLVDNALTFACGTVLGSQLVTGGLTVTYLAGARAGLLRATARCERPRGPPCGGDGDRGRGRARRLRPRVRGRPGHGAGRRCRSGLVK